MKNTFLKTKLVPAVALSLCLLLYFSGYFQMIAAALIFLIASAIEYGKDWFKSLGFKRSKFTVKNLLILAPIVGLISFLFFGGLIMPFVEYLTGKPLDYSAFEKFEGNLPAILGLLVYVWLSAAFGEEIVFRGYLMRQFTKLFGSSKLSLVLNILTFGVLFGLSHFYQGITGMLLTGIIGMCFAILFHVRKYDLWFNIVLHGFYDTVGLVFMYYGWL